MTRETPAGAVEALAAMLHPETCTLPEMAHTSVEFAKCNRIALNISEAFVLTRSVDVERWQRIETAAGGIIPDDPRWDDDSCHFCFGWLGKPTEMKSVHNGHTGDCSWVALRDALGEGQK